MDTHHSRSIAALALLLIFAAPFLVSAQDSTVNMSPSSGAVNQSSVNPPSSGSINQGSVNPPSNGAVNNYGKGSIFYLQNPLKFNTVGGLVGGFLEIFSFLVIIFAVLVLIWVGLKFILAQGNAEEIKKLKGWLLWIVVGVAIVIGARIIVRVVIDTLSASGAVDQRVIDSANSGLRNTNNP